MRGIFFAAALLLTGLSTELFAQTIVSVPAGSRVRLSVEQEGRPGALVRSVGTLISTDDESVVVRTGTDAEPRTFSAASLQKFEVSMGRRSRTGRGALIGAVGLGTVSAVQSYIEESRCEPHPFDMGTLGGCGSPGGMAVLGFAVGAVIGAGAGALIGSFVRADRWMPVSLGVRSALVPAGEGVALSFSAMR
jgi:hypothetical protein